MTYLMIPTKIVEVSEDKLKFVVTEDPPPEPGELQVDWRDIEQVSQGYSQPYSRPNAGDPALLALTDSYCNQYGIPTVARTKEPDSLAAGGHGEWFVLPSCTPKRLELTIGNRRSINLRDPGFVQPGSVRIDERGQLSMIISKSAAAVLGLPGLADAADGRDAGRDMQRQPAEPEPDRPRASADPARVREFLRALANLLD